MQRKSARLMGLSLGMALALGGFQNCSGAKFSQATSDSLSAQSLPDTNSNITALVCSAGSDQNAVAQQYYPTACLKDPKLAADAVGLEINNPFLLVPKNSGQSNILYLNSDSASGTSKDTQLYMEVATYAAPDTFIVSAVDAMGNETKILDICNISTATYADPSKNINRPYSDTILQFNVVMPKGTVQLKLDFTGSMTNSYLGIWNLNEFGLGLNDPSNNPFTALNRSTNYRVVQGLPAALNDNADPTSGLVCQ